MSSIISFIQSYGYIAVFVGSVFEGETIILLGGISVHETYLFFPLVVLFSTLGAITGDWCFFFLGRRKKKFLSEKLLKFPRFTRVSQSFIEKNPKFISFAMRFMYGFRHIVPMSIGMSRVPTTRFLAWNFFGAVSWAFTIASAGYIVGEVLENIFGKIRRYEFRIIVFTIIAVAVFSVAGRILRMILRKTETMK